jgi:uncharacterized protein
MARVATIVLALSNGCGRNEVVRTQPSFELRMVTGNPGAGYYPLGNALAAAYQRALPSLHIQVENSTGSVSNIEAIQAGRDDVGFAFADTAYLAYIGRLGGSPFDRIRAVALLQVSPVHLVVRSGTGIRNIMDLRGHRVGIGPPGSGTAPTVELLLRAHGLSLDAIHAAPLAMNAAAAALNAGRLDAMFADAGYPAGSVMTATTGGARLVPIEGAFITRLRNDYPFFVPVAIPANTYVGHQRSVHTVGVQSILICRRDLDQSLVYELTREFLAALPSLSADQPALSRIRLSDIAATPIPLHEGAARYYRESELMR